MVKLNEHQLAIAVSKREGGKVNLSIAQVKEVIKATFDEIAHMFYEAEIEMSQVCETIEAHVN